MKDNKQSDEVDEDDDQKENKLEPPKEFDIDEIIYWLYSAKYSKPGTMMEIEREFIDKILDQA